MRIVVHVNNIYSFIKGKLDKKVLEELIYHLSYEVPGAQHSPKYRQGLWDGRIKLFYRNGRFYTGLISQVLQILQEHGVKCSFVDHRKKPPMGEDIPVRGIKLRKYQKDAINNSIEQQRGVVKIPSGGGKTEIIAGIAGRLNLSTIIFVHRKELMYQTQRRLEKRLGVKVGIAGCGIVNVKQLNVVMMQTAINAIEKKRRGKYEKSVYMDDDKLTKRPDLQKIKKLMENVDVFMVDEAHHVVCSTLRQLNTQCKSAFYKFGFSATPFRDDNANLLIAGIFGKRSADISASELIKKKYLVPPKIYLYQFEHEKYPSYLSYQELYKLGVVSNLKRNMDIIKVALKVIKSGRTVLVAVTQIEHGENIFKLLKRYSPKTKVRFVYGQKDTSERNDALRRLNSKKLECAIVTTIWGEGLDIPSLGAIIIAKAQKSKVDSLQLVGRVLRTAEEKDIGIVVDFQDVNCKYLKTHARERVKVYSEEKLFETIPVSLVDEIDV